jgi:hypothetical protein
MDDIQRAALESDLATAGKVFRGARGNVDRAQGALYQAIRAGVRAGLSMRAVALAAGVSLGTVHRASSEVEGPIEPLPATENEGAR